MLKIRKIEDSIFENARREYRGDITSYGKVVFGDVLKEAYVLLGIVFESAIYGDNEKYEDNDLKNFIVEERLSQLNRKFKDDLKCIKRSFEGNFGIRFSSDRDIVFIFNNDKVVTISSLDYGVISSTSSWEV